MAGEDKNLRETLAEAVGEAKNQTNTVGAKETNSELSKGQETETKSGEPVYVSGIDISDVPEGDRPRIKELLEKKVKSLEGGYQEKFKEIASFKKAQEELVQSGLTVEEAKQVLANYVDSKKNPVNKEQKEAKKLLDNLIDSAPSEQKESLRQLRQILMEETDIGKIRQELNEMKQVLGNVSAGFTNTKRREIESEFSSLEDRYGKDLVSKYRDVMIDEALKHGVSPSQVLRFRASDDEIEQAISQKHNRKKEKLNAISSTPSGVSSAETISTKGSFADVIRDVIKTRR